jgi:hypothetical protein
MSEEAYYSITKAQDPRGYWILKVFDKQENLILASIVSEKRLKEELEPLFDAGCIPLAEKWLNDVYGVSFGGAQ